MLIILQTSHTPTGCLWQDDPLELIHLPSTPKKINITYPTQVSSLIFKGRVRSRELFGRDTSSIIIPYKKEQLDFLLNVNDEWPIALQGFYGEILFHLPNHPLLHFMTKVNTIFPKNFSHVPLDQASLIFTDGSSNGIAVTIINDQEPIVQQTTETSAQRTEVIAIITAFEKVTQPFNLYTDSQYIVNLFPAIETSSLSSHSSIVNILQKLQKLILQRSYKFFIGHIRGHSNLPGPLVAGNAKADLLTRTVYNVIEQATKDHQLHHQNSAALRAQFHITKEQARQIVKQCQICPTHFPSPQMGVNPRGLLPNKLWWMDITHIQEFGKLSFVHVCVDTFSHVIFATARTGEAYKDIAQHLFASFAYMGLPLHIKTDNAPAYISKTFKHLCQTLNIVHSTGIPYNPQGQAIVERAHQTLKSQINKLKEGELHYSSPHQILQHALFVINHLNVNDSKLTPMQRHWSEQKVTQKPLVKWKDLLTGQWKGPDILLTLGRGYACVFPQDATSPLWIPDRLIRHYDSPTLQVEVPPQAIPKDAIDPG